MRNVTYKSGDTARMLGISQEAIRYYEKQGIVLFDKTEENGYRSFQFRKLLAMVSLRLFGRMGLPVHTAWDMVNGAVPESVCAELAANEQQLADQIERMTQMQDFSAEMRREIEQIPQNLYQYSIRQAPGFYHIKFQNDRQIIKDKQYQKIIKSWYENSPAVQAGIVAPLDKFRPGYQAEVGFSVRQDHFQRWIGELHPAVHFIPGGPALYAVGKVEPDCTEFYEPMQPIVEYFRTSGLVSKNLIHAIPLAMRCRLDETQPMKDYYQVYIPLETPPAEE